MGFALWTDDELAWAEGRHEYRPMGTAVVALSDLFRQRDFRSARKSIPGHGGNYAGLFASLGDLSDYLVSRRATRSQRPRQAGHRA